MNDTIFHAVRDYLPSRLLLAQQWVARINHEHKLLTVRIEAAKREGAAAVTRAEVDYLTWRKRLAEDIKLIETRLQEDGFVPSEKPIWEHQAASQMRIPISEQNIPLLLTDGTDFTPDITDGVENVTHVWVWRKAVQS